MSAELNLRFPDRDHVIVRYADAETSALPFTNPLTANDRQRLQWYLETYGAHSLGDPDDKEAKTITDLLPVWGKALFKAVFQHDDARNAFTDFRAQRDGTRLVTISANHPAILALPWELLHDTATGRGFLFMENPRISIRRRVSGATGGSQPFRIAAKDTLHLLFVVARPVGSGFLDPRADPGPCSPRSMRTVKGASPPSSSARPHSTPSSSASNPSACRKSIFSTSTATASLTNAAVFPPAPSLRKIAAAARTPSTSSAKTTVPHRRRTAASRRIQVTCFLKTPRASSTSSPLTSSAKTSTSTRSPSSFSLPASLPPSVLTTRSKPTTARLRARWAVSLPGSPAPASPPSSP